MMISPSQLPLMRGDRSRSAAGNHCHSSSASGPASCPSAADPSAADPAAAAAAAGQAGNCQKNDDGSHARAGSGNYYPPGGSGDPSDENQPDGGLDGADASAQQSQRLGKVVKEWYELFDEAKQLLVQLRSDEHNAHRHADCRRRLVQLSAAYALDDSTAAADVYARNLQSFINSVLAFASSPKEDDAASGAEEDRAEATTTTSSHDAGEACDSVLDECADNDPFDNDIVAMGVDPHMDGEAVVGTTMATAAEVKPGTETNEDAADSHSSVAEEGSDTEVAGVVDAEPWATTISATALVKTIFDESVIQYDLSDLDAGNNAIPTIVSFLGRSHDGESIPGAMAASDQVTVSVPAAAVSDVMEDSNGDIEFKAICNSWRMNRIFGTHATVAAEKISELLAQLTISQDRRSASFEEIYRDAYRFNWDGQKIKEKLIEEGVLTGSGTLAPALPVHNLSSSCSTMQTRPTLVYILVRWSPQTSNKGYAQVVRIVVALFYLAMKGGEFEVHPVVFAGPEVKRDKSHLSGGIELLFQSLRITPDDRSVIVLASEVLRISSEPAQVDTFMRSVKALQPPADVKTLKEYGMHLVPVVSILASEASQRSNICATVGSHNNAGRDVDVNPELAPMRERVEEMAMGICNDIESYKSLITNATDRGANHSGGSQLALLWIKALKSVELRENTATEAASNLVSEAGKELSQSLKKDGHCKKRICLYLRDSPGDSSRKMVYGRLPLDQLASCLALYRLVVEYGGEVFSDSELIIFHDAGKERRSQCNPAFANLLSLVVGGGLDDCQNWVISPDTARISDSPDAIELLEAVFAHKDVKARRLFSRLVGQNHSAVAQKEGQRKKSQMSALLQRKRKLEDQRKEDISCKEMRAQSDVLREISYLPMHSFPGVVIPQKEWDRQAKLGKRKREEENAQRKRKREEENAQRKRVVWPEYEQSARYETIVSKTVADICALDGSPTLSSSDVAQIMLKHGCPSNRLYDENLQHVIRERVATTRRTSGGAANAATRRATGGAASDAPQAASGGAANAEARRASGGAATTIQQTNPRDLSSGEKVVVSNTVAALVNDPSIQDVSTLRSWRLGQIMKKNGCPSNKIYNEHLQRVIRERAINGKKIARLTILMHKASQSLAGSSVEEHGRSLSSAMRDSGFTDGEVGNEHLRKSVVDLARKKSNN